MATPIIVGVGAIAAAFAGRTLLRRAGKSAAEEWVKGGFKSKMDRKEAIAILGLKYVVLARPRENDFSYARLTGTARR